MAAGSSTRGFTLIELLIAVAIVGVLASVALPTFNNFVMQSKRSEAYANLGTLYLLAQSYYQNGHAAKGITANAAGGCLVGVTPYAAGPPMPPTSEKRTFDFSSEEAYAALGFQPASPVYYTYFMISRLGGSDIEYGCGNQDLWGDWAYEFVAFGDLDGDGRVSGQGLSVGLESDGTMRRGGAIGELPTGWIPGLDIESE
ncbi:MAG: prepilin-type N-terminal cleavage/methylation domain-containing protein [Myxococcales bacterium]|nr:prepilin-type N-terminal cleavage/methylation domain-containing protein [Myxococcales bacterium]